MESNEITVPSFDELTFEEEKHIYRLSGKYVPAVSTVMKPLSQALYKGVDEALLNKAAERGTAVHNAIENYVLYGLKDIPEEYAGYFSAFLDWWNETKPEALATESKVYHKIYPIDLRSR